MSDAGVDAPSDAAVVDAGRAEGTLREVDAPDGHCASGCADLGFPCTTICDGTAGFASYGYYDWDIGLYRSVHQEDFATCDDVPAATWSEGGETYEMGRQVCCCEVPAVDIVSARSGDDRTCTQICIDAGHTACADFHDWPSEDTNGGTRATYYRAATGSVTDVIMGCEANPPLTRRIAGAERTLRDYRCACQIE